MTIDYIALRDDVETLEHRLALAASESILVDVYKLERILKHYHEKDRNNLNLIVKIVELSDRLEEALTLLDGARGYYECTSESGCYSAKVKAFLAKE